MKVYQLVAIGYLAHFEGKSKVYSKNVYVSKEDALADEQRLKEVATDENYIKCLDENYIEFHVIELDLVGVKGWV